MLTTFFAIVLILLLGGATLLAMQMREGWITLGLGIAGTGFFVSHVLSYGFVAGGLAIIPLGMWLWKKD